jgi:hypothetical protein
MARASNTPIYYFMQLPIRNLYQWITSANEVEEEDKEEERKSRK